MIALAPAVISQTGSTASQETCRLLDVFVNIPDGVCR
jgi:hypothetical protein